MRILCLDIGSKRVGIAVSDPLKVTAQPVMTVELNNLFKVLDDMFQKFDIEKVVIGYPLSKLHPDQKNEKLIKIDEISEKIRARYNVEIIKWDERFSTKAVERVMGEIMNWRKRKEIIDKVAAVYILQGYLDFYNGR